MAIRVPRAAEQLGWVESACAWRRPPEVDSLLEAAAELPASTTRAIVHGDLHFRHVVVGADGALAGVIDWDDVCLADPCVDFVLAVSYLPPGGLAEFLAEYGSVSDQQLLRARVLALSVCAALAAYGRDEGRPNVEREALAGLERVAAG